MGRLEGKTAVITGGTSGIGLASAKRFATEGAFVYIFGRRHAELDGAVRAIAGKAKGIQGDVSKLEDLDRLFATVSAARGTIDVLFANAGLGNLAPLGAITAEQFDQVFDVNVKGTLFTVQKALPLLKNGSSIILTGSTTGAKGTAACSVYSASKAAIRNFARSWAVDPKGTGTDWRASHTFLFIVRFQSRPLTSIQTNCRAPSHSHRHGVELALRSVWE
jgi:NAD(P)-dependent dehydrogenase (short-subunit alcohol dehydrogenase family)